MTAANDAWEEMEEYGKELAVRNGAVYGVSEKTRKSQPSSQCTKEMFAENRTKEYQDQGGSKAEFITKI